MQTIDWTFGGQWPYAPQWFDTEEGRMHFIDAGPRIGRPVVLLHGNPTWGYLWRKIIPPLIAAGHRVVVPDHLGFGRSDKPSRPEVCTVERHARRLEALLESLQLHNATLVPHDWGGPIGLYWATRHHERIANMVILNTFIHRPTGPVSMPLPLRMFRAPWLGEFFVKTLHGLVRIFLFKAGVSQPLSAVDRAAYLAPHPTRASRTAALKFAREFPNGPDGAVAELEEKLHTDLAKLSTRPALIIWAKQDVVMGEAELRLWERDFPRAKVVELPDAKHFLQDEEPQRIIDELLEFLSAQG